jgi:hypothetical protein
MDQSSRLLISSPWILHLPARNNFSPRKYRIQSVVLAVERDKNQCKLPRWRRWQHEVTLPLRLRRSLETGRSAARTQIPVRHQCLKSPWRNPPLRSLFVWDQGVCQVTLPTRSRYRHTVLLEPPDIFKLGVQLSHRSN